MTLSGNLGFVPIDEVLRLLTRSHQQGSIDVTGDGVRGRVFFGETGIDLATTYDDHDLHRHLVNSSYADESVLGEITSGGKTLAGVADHNPAIIDLLRELTVEGLYQMASRGEQFEVREGATTPYASPEAFELEGLLEDVQQRTTDWQKVTRVVPDLGAAVQFRRDLGDREEVTVRVDDWKFLSEIGTGSSVVEIADRLGTTEFWTARVAARLHDDDLILMDGDGVPVVDPTMEDTNTEPDPAETQVIVDETAAEATPDTPAEDAKESVFETPTDDADDDVDPDESWWQEPRDKEPAADDIGSRTPAVVSEGLSEIPAVEAAEEDDGEDDDGDVEEDTEAFLEKVFSELDSSDDEPQGGHGLLRRRRMGTLRDFSSDS